MAYTYDNFVSDANAAGLMNRFSEQDLRVAQRNPEFGLSLLGLLKDNGNAQTAEQQLLATEAANQLRKSYGVYNTGTLGNDSAYAGSYGSQINGLMDQIRDYGSFDYDGQDSYQQLLDSLVNQQPFSYDLQSDPSYSAYRKAYLREGERASANALAQAAAASGGQLSSYAISAAQQAGNYYAGQLADIIPTLEQNAYARYLSDFNNRLSSLGALENDRAFDYQNWMNGYNMLQNSLGNYQNQDATDYQRYLDAYAHRYQAEQDKLAQEQQAYQNALALYQTLGYATPEVAKILGISAGSGGGGGTGYGGDGTVSGGDGEVLGGDDTGNIDKQRMVIDRIPDAQLNAMASTGVPVNRDDIQVDLSGLSGLGYGGMTAAQLNAKLNSGEIEMYMDGNMVRFRRRGGSGGGLVVDMNSILALGYGSISESRLNELVEAGEVKEVVDGNVIRFERVAQPPATASNNPYAGQNPSGGLALNMMEQRLLR